MSATIPEPGSELDLAWREGLLRTEAQALDDLSRTGGAEVLFLRHTRPAAGWEYLDALQPWITELGFVSARVSVLSERAFDTFDSLVRAVGRTLIAPGLERGDKGVVALLETFHARHGARAVEEFEQGIAKHHAVGDLVELSRAWLRAARRPAREAARIEAWLSGTELSRADEEVVALSAVSPRTAKRALGELTQLSRALGWRGTVILFEGADVLAKLPPGRRDDAYTVLRELIDNADGGRGLVATQIVLTGTMALYAGARSIASLRPLAMRVEPPEDAPPGLPPPHRPCVDLAPPPGWTPGPLSEVRPCGDEALTSLRTLIRAAQGLPPVDPVVSMSVGHERIDAAIDALFEHSAMESSVFALLTGAYGTGKSHLLMHLAARALADRRPVLRLSLERLDSDLGNPQRHLRRLLEHAVLPLPGSPGPLDRLVAWTRSATMLRKLISALEAVVDANGDAAPAARKALSGVSKKKHWGASLESWLGAGELVGKPNAPNYRHDAYTRLLLWFALLERLEQCGGPVLLIDEAENLYRGGTTRAERRTALRSLSFYCGGTLPQACVVLAITPSALEDLRREAGELLDDVSEQRTVLAWEDAAMLRHRLTAVRAIEVPALTSQHRVVLAYRVGATHARVRGPVRDPEWAKYVSALVSRELPPREVIRRATDRLERLWWSGAGV